jgi:CO/xanthine dehydrogenase Mo-binding subunit
LARAAPGHPVRVVWSRADELAASPLGPGMAARAEAVVGDDGRIVAFTIDISSQPHGQRPGANAPANLLAAAHLASPSPKGPASDPAFAGGGGADRNALPGYAIPNTRVVKRIIRDLPVRTSSLRALGAFMNVFAIETLMDDIAHEIGADPLALRLAHLDDPRAREVLRRTADMAGWPDSPGDGSALGLAFARYKLKAAYCAVVVQVEIDETVRVRQAWTGVDAGEVINPDGIANQIEGGVIQAASWTLKEAVRFQGDAVITRDWETYPIMRFNEIPEVAVDIIERSDQPPLGVGEASMGPTAAAIGNAVRRALGVRVRDLPLTREAIIAALG